MKDKDILNQMLKNSKNECFITLKDHKPSFKNNPKVRSTLRKMKQVKLNHQLRDSLRINQWKDTSEVTEWFLKIPDRNWYKFAIFDIKDFYLSILEKLSTNVLNFAKEITDTSREDIEIMSPRQKIIFVQ